MKKIINLFLIFLLLGLALTVNAAEIILNSNPSANTTVSTATISSGAIFARNLTVGSSGQDVMALKKIIGLELNTTIDTSVSFTSKTTSAVKKFQEKYATEILIPNGLSSGTGFVGPSTRTKLNQLVSKYSIKLSDFTVPIKTQTTSAVKSVFTTNLKLGSLGDDISLLKIVLNSDNDTRVAVNSSSVANVFDLATQNAVNKFQEKYATEILIPNGLSSGTGFVGPSTRKKLDSILNDILYSTKTSGTSATNNSSSVSLNTSSDYQSYIISSSYNTNTVTTPSVSATPPIAGKTDSFAPTIAFKADPVQVAVGQQTTLTWSANNATGQCKITSKDSAGNMFSSTIKTSDYRYSGPINKNTTYTIICYNKYGIPGTKSITVNVINPVITTTTPQQTTRIATIISVNPSVGNRGDTVTIKGSDFISANTVFFDGAKIDDNLILSESSTSISFKIPDYKSCPASYCPPPAVDTVVETGGKRTIQVSNTNGFSNTVVFTLPSKMVTILANPYYSSKLAISSVSPSSGNRGDKITISGSGFLSDSIVLFGGFKVADNLIVSKTNSSIIFIVPPFQLGCTEPDIEICPRLPVSGTTGLTIETGGVKTIYVMNMSDKSTSTPVQFTLPSKKIAY